MPVFNMAWGGGGYSALGVLLTNHLRVVNSEAKMGIQMQQSEVWKIHVSVPAFHKQNGNLVIMFDLKRTQTKMEAL